MRVGRFYTHKRMTDVMMRLRGFAGHWETGETMIVEWWHRRGWQLTERLDLIYISSKEWENWYEFMA